MSKTELVAPQMVLHSRMIYTSWIPEDPDACARLLPPALQPAQNHAVYMNQYVVDSPEQTTGFGAYSLTYLGVDVAGYPTPDGASPGRFFTHYFNSSKVMRDYVTKRGVPATPGRTILEFEGNVLTAITHVDERPVIRTRARVGEVDLTVSGHLRYITRVEDRLMSGYYPYIGELVSPFEVLSIEFLDPDHSVYKLRPKKPLDILPAASFYSPKDSFVYPGGEEDLGLAT